MNPTFERKGQTALEYLLIVVVAIIVVVAVMVWMQGTTDDAVSSADDQVGRVICSAYTDQATCDGNSDCSWDSTNGCQPA